jgi:hypothetical protein
VTGADDDFRLRRNLLDVFDNVPATEAGHPQVNDGRVKCLLVQGLEGRFTVFAKDDIVSHARQFDFHDIANVCFVVDEQDSQFVNGSSSQRAVSLPQS